MTDVKRLLSEATPLPWYQTDEPNDGDAALILHVVNHLPDYLAAVDALRMLVAAAHDTDRNMRNDDGSCIECGRTDAHDDPDCGMAGLAVWAERAVVALARLRDEVPV